MNVSVSVCVRVCVCVSVCVKVCMCIDQVISGYSEDSKICKASFNHFSSVKCFENIETQIWSDFFQTKNNSILSMETFIRAQNLPGT